MLAQLKSTLLDAAHDRPEALRVIDEKREADPAWLRAPGQSVHTFYVDRFAGSLHETRGRLDYLSEFEGALASPLPA